MQPTTPARPFADPTALGLFGLAIGCAALLPLGLGMEAALTPAALTTAAWYSLLFGGACQFLAGLMSFRNGNGLGGTLLTAFSFNWCMNFWALRELAQGRVPSAEVVLAVDLCFVPIFLMMTWAFAYSSKLFVALLVDIDLLYLLRITREVLHAPALGPAIAACTFGLLVLSLYIAFAIVLWEATGRLVLPIPGPLIKKATAEPGGST
jgi:succinate-acetate transporter protein